MAVIKGTINSDWMYGTEGNDTIIGLAGLDHFYSSKGNDLFNGTDDRDNTFYDDTLAYGFNDAWGNPTKGVKVNLTTNIGTDGWGYTDRYINIYNVSGTQFNDTLIGNAGHNELIGEGGDDYIDGKDGNDSTWYGLATAGIKVDLQTGKVTGGAGNDTLISIESITATNFKDIIYGSAKDEWFTLDAYGNSIAPNSTVGTDDYLNGRGGMDGVQYYQYSQGVKVYLNQEYAIDGTGHRDTLISIEYVNGSQGSDYIYGSDANNNLVGGAGNDTIYGGNGNDFLAGDAGSDKIYGGAGNDTIYGGNDKNTLVGGTGNDIYVVTGSDTVVESAGQGTDTIQVYFTWDISKTANVERLALMGSDIIDGKGNSLANLITGNVAANKIWGMAGNDRINSGLGNDQLFGGDGNDTLWGGAGQDKLYGGAGNDTFVFRASETGATKTNADTIYDFTSADHINLAAIDASTKASGNQSFDFIGTQGFHGKAGELRYDKASSDTYVYGDVNGDRKADFVIHLDDAVTLKAGYFVL